MKKSLGSMLVNLAYKVKGAGGTCNARADTASRFAAFLRGRNINIELVEHIKQHHIIDYVESRKVDVGIGTIANEMSHLRKILVEVGREQFVKHPNLSNKNLGIGGRSRKGTKIPCPYSEFQKFFCKAKRRDIGFAVCLMLCFYFGLRRNEAIQSIHSVKTWLVQLSEGKDSITVVFGTKGGKVREVRIFNKSMAITILKFALLVMKERKGRLIDKPTLKQAGNFFSNSARSIGMTGQLSPHSLRYTFAVNNVNSYLAEGASWKESLGRTSVDLGHSPCRDRYVKNVYGQTLVKPLNPWPDIKSLEELYKD